MNSMTIKKEGSGFEVCFKFDTDRDKRIAFQQTEQKKEHITGFFDSSVYIRFEKSGIGELKAFFAETSLDEIKSSLNSLFPCIFVKG